MPTNMTVESATAETVGDTAVWRVLIRYPGGDGVTHVFPASTLDWRAAEYGVDPTDTDTLLDIILHEPHMDAEGTGDLWTADTTDAAREAHLGKVKDCPVRVGVRGAKALDAIRAGHRPNAARIREMRELVDTTRWLKKYGDLPKRPLPDVPSPSGGTVPVRPVPARRP